MHNVIENLQRVISGARAKGISVLFGPIVMSMRDQSAKELCRICADFYEACAAEGTKANIVKNVKKSFIVQLSITLFSFYTFHLLPWHYN